MNLELKTKANPNFYQNENVLVVLFQSVIITSFITLIYLFKNIVFSDNLKQNKNGVLATWESPSVYPQESDFNNDVSS